MMNSLKDLYIHEIKDIHSANKQAAETTGMFARELKHEALSQKLFSAEEKIKANNGDLETIAKLHDEKASGMHCKGMEGLCTEGKKHVLHSDYSDDALKASVAISQFQRMTHYALSGYGTAHAYAIQLGDTEGAKILKGLLDETYDGDRSFTDMAVETVNEQASSISGDTK